MSTDGTTAGRSSAWPLLSVLWAFAALPSCFVAFVSGMLFDAPGSESSALTVAFFRTLLAWPLSWLAGAGLPWVFRRHAFAKWFYLLPFMNLAVAVGIGVAIQVACGGKLTCR